MQWSMTWSSSHVMNFSVNLEIHLPVVSLILKNDVNGLFSETSPYLISRGFPLSPSSACTCKIYEMKRKYINNGKKTFHFTIEKIIHKWRNAVAEIQKAEKSTMLITLSPGNKEDGSRVTGGAVVKIGGTSCTSWTMTTTSSPAMFRESCPGSAYASCT